MIYCYYICFLATALKWNVTICFLLLCFLAVKDISPSFMSPLNFFLWGWNKFFYKVILKPLRASEKLLIEHDTKSTESKHLVPYLQLPGLQSAAVIRTAVIIAVILEFCLQCFYSLLLCPSNPEYLKNIRLPPLLFW